MLHAATVIMCSIAILLVMVHYRYQLFIVLALLAAAVGFWWIAGKTAPSARVKGNGIRH